MSLDGGAGESPFIIWTFRRTGGTSLRSIFFWLSPFPAWQDEAFNRDRELGEITRDFEASGRRDALDRSVGDVVRQKKNLKHCIETVPYEVSSSLLRAAIGENYRHLVLLRHNEVDRQLSLSLARQTSAWGPGEARDVYSEIRRGERKLEPFSPAQVRRDLERDAAALGRLIRLMLRYRVPHAITSFEDLYAGDFSARVAEVRRVASLLGLRRAESEPDDSFRSALVERSQQSREMYDLVPNIDEIRELIESLTS